MVLASETTELVRELVRVGWKVSPKSVTIPSHKITCMGKIIEGTAFSVRQSTASVAQMVGIRVRLSCQGYYEKHVCRLVGKIIWAAAPGRLVMPFLQGPIAWTTWAIPCSPYTPPKVLKSLREAVSLDALPYRAQEIKQPKYTWYVDAARSPVGCVAVVWGPNFGYRILSTWVASQQSGYKIGHTDEAQKNPFGCIQPGCCLVCNTNKRSSRI